MADKAMELRMGIAVGICSMMATMLSEEVATPKEKVVAMHKNFFACSALLDPNEKVPLALKLDAEGVYALHGRSNTSEKITHTGYTVNCDFVIYDDICMREQEISARTLVLNKKDADRHKLRLFYQLNALPIDYLTKESHKHINDTRSFVLGAIVDLLQARKLAFHILEEMRLVIPLAGGAAVLPQQCVLLVLGKADSLLVLKRVRPAGHEQVKRQKTQDSALHKAVEECNRRYITSYNKKEELVKRVGSCMPQEGCPLLATKKSSQTDIVDALCSQMKKKGGAVLHKHCLDCVCNTSFSQFGDTSARNASLTGLEPARFDSLGYVQSKSLLLPLREMEERDKKTSDVLEALCRGVKFDQATLSTFSDQVVFSHGKRKRAQEDSRATQEEKEREEEEGEK